MSKIVEVFLASPGDMEAERAIVRECVNTFNDQWGSEFFGLMFHVIGWEAVPSVAQRPQSRINEEANKSDIFVGLMGRRWGTESGEYSSGFYEEFQVARQRLKATGRPEISMFFRTPDKALLDDIGPQLSLVRKFRQELIDGKEILFHDFSADEDLRKHVNAVLIEYCKKSRVSATQTNDTDPTPPLNSPVGEGDQDPAATGNDVAAVLCAAGAPILDETQERLDFWGALRLHLYALGLYSKRRPYVLLTTHEINLVYRKKRDWAVTPAERIALVNAMLSDAHGYAPGWFWLTDNDTDALRSRLTYFLVADGVGKETAARIVGDGDELPPFDIVEFAIRDSATFRSILRLLKRIGTAEHLVLFEQPNELRKTDAHAFSSAHFAILLREGKALPADLVLMHAVDYVDDAARMLEQQVRVMDDEARTALLGAATSKRARQVVIRALTEADALDPGRAERLLDDPDKAVRELAVQALCKSGRSFTMLELDNMFPASKAAGLMSSIMDWVDKDKLFGEGLRWRAYEELRPLLDYFDGAGRQAHGAMLADHFDKYVPEVERQIDTDFEALLQESEAKTKAQGYSRIAIWAKSDNSLIESMRRDFIGSSLAAATSHGYAKALVWAQKYAAAKYHEDLRSRALVALVQLDSVPDLEFFRDDIKNLSADAIGVLLPIFLKTHQVDIRMIEAAASNKALDVREIVIRAINEQWRDASAPLFESLLASADEKVRTLAAIVMWSCVEREALEVVLDRYIEQPSYYYDVAALLDMAVYAVPPYAERLKQRAIAGMLHKP
ncbi:DUF4062 domain-containing protein [Methylibium rhizosphaerae]|uniref:DUF4062 domain-containing protein n=1 Tax=Methylibium rhizosphaerae TaxID=2570323 RepID=UPI0011282B2C|nr:DUF4062 domain-containing protein [Methylibium rhizosphaerae]